MTIAVKPANTEISLSTANTVYNSKLVRLVNINAGAALVTLGAVANGTLAGTFTIRSNSEIIVPKQPLDTLASNTAILACPVAWL